METAVIDKVTKPRSDYSFRLVRIILKNYFILAEGHMPPPEDLSEFKSLFQRSPSLKAAFERPIQLAVDVSRALKKLTRFQRSVVITILMVGLSYGEIGNWEGKTEHQVKQAEIQAIKTIKRYLNSGKI